MKGVLGTGWRKVVDYTGFLKVFLLITSSFPGEVVFQKLSGNKRLSLYSYKVPVRKEGFMWVLAGVGCWVESILIFSLFIYIISRSGLPGRLSACNQKPAPTVSHAPACYPAISSPVIRFPPFGSASPALQLQFGVNQIGFLEI